MFYNDKIWIGDAEGEKVCIIPKMANRHGLIAGATGTGKTVTLKVLAESFSKAGVPVFLTDVKGDLSGMVHPGEDSENMQKRIERFGLAEAGFKYQTFPSVFWDIYGEMGIPLRTTISEMGPVLLSKLLDLNQTQSDILQVVFKIADDNDLLLIDTKDLKAILQYVGDHSKEFQMHYGNISKTSAAAILRHIVSLEAQGGDRFFTEPALDIGDWFGNDLDGRGNINILDCRQLANDSILYSAFLLWMLSELFEILPEVGDKEKPRMVFFFDEAHLLFNGISKALEDKIEQIVKLIRSKGVGIFFITQNPADIPDGVLGQLGNKIQHALHAYTPSDMKAVRTAANSFRTNPAFDTAEVITQLGVGEALISVLDEGGIPTIVQRCKVLPPESYMGPIEDNEKKELTCCNKLYWKYKDMVDRDSAYEFLQRKKLADEESLAAARQEELERKEAEKAAAAAEKEAAKAAAAAEREAARAAAAAEKEAAKQAAAEAREAEKKKKAVQSSIGRVGSTAAGTIGREVGNALGQTVGGSFGKKIGGNVGASIGRNLFGTIFKK